MQCRTDDVNERKEKLSLIPTANSDIDLASQGDYLVSITIMGLLGRVRVYTQVE